MDKLKVLIGRSSQCDYTIENPSQHGTVSGNHATLSETSDPTVFLLEDHSTNGSYVNGHLLHNASCQVRIEDHITLGKTYTLPLADIARRYFSSSKTSKKIPQSIPESQLDPAATRLTPVSLEDQNATRMLSQSEVAKDTSGTTFGDEAKKVPALFWVLLVALVIIAFVIGFIC